MSHGTRMTGALAAVAVGLALAACASTPSANPASHQAPTPASSVAPSSTPFPAALNDQEPYHPTIDPANFVAAVDNRYFPLVPGSRWVMKGEGDSAGEVTTTMVTSQTRMILGVRCTVVRDEVKADGALQELTHDWYAQDADGNVWYFGEDTAEYEHGAVSTREGSWEAGVNGAEPGIIMPAEPVLGLAYRQEFLAGQAEDQASAVALEASASTPAGQYTGVLVTEDFTPLEPNVVERKFYAPGVGLVMERTVSGPSGVNRLTEFTAGE